MVSPQTTLADLLHCKDSRLRGGLHVLQIVLGHRCVDRLLRDGRVLVAEGKGQSSTIRLHLLRMTLESINHDFVNFFCCLVVVFHGQIVLIDGKITIHLEECDFASVWKNTNWQIA